MNTTINNIQTKFFLFLVSIAIFFVSSSCEKENEKFNEFNASINGKKIEGIGIATRNISSSGDTSFVIHTKAISFTEKFYFWNIPNISTTTHLNSNDFIGKLNQIDSANKLNTYISSSGELVITQLDNAVLQGKFNLLFVNSENNLDTLNVTFGNFKISYSTVWLTK